jgi:hypothetical protein
MQTLPTKLPEIRGSSTLEQTGTRSAFGLPKMSAPRYKITIDELVKQGTGKPKFENNIDYNLPQSH